MPGDSRRHVGAANPRALAELRAGRRIDWEKEDCAKTLERLLDTPHTRLFDPAFGSPIYAGVPLDFSHRRCPVHIDGGTDIKKLFDQTQQAQDLVAHGLVSTSVLRRPTTNLRQFAAAVADQIGQDLETLNHACHRQADARQTQRASELAVATRLMEISAATLVEVRQISG